MTNDSTEMLIARSIVEKHISAFGMVPHPDLLKEAIAKEIAKYRFCRSCHVLLSRHCPQCTQDWQS